MARARLSYDKRMMQRLSRSTSTTPADWQTIADKHTGVYRLEYSSPWQSGTIRVEVLALNALHAAAIVQRRLEVVAGPMDTSDACVNVTILRLGRNEPWAGAHETEAERLARYQEMERVWMNGAKP